MRDCIVQTKDGRQFDATWDRANGIAWRDGNAWIHPTIGNETHARENSRSFETAEQILPLGLTKIH